MKVTLVHNPGAGHEETAEHELEAALKAGGYEIKQTVRNKGDKFDKAMADPGKLVVVWGGDGTVARVIKRLAGQDVPLAILPGGTANNIAFSLGLKGSTEEMIAGWKDARRVRYGVATATGPWGEKVFVESLGTGLFAEGMLALEHEGKTAEGYQAPEEEVTRARHALADRLAHMKPRNVSLTLDGVDRSGSYLLVEVMNIRAIGPNLLLAPEASPDDKWLDVVLVSEEDRETFDRFLRDGAADPTLPAGVHVSRARRVKLDAERSRLHRDDKVWPDKGTTDDHAATEVKAELTENAVEVLVPR